MITKTLRVVAAVAAALALAQVAQAAPENRKDKEDGAKRVERGRYLVKIAGCNECHTPGFAAAGGKVPEAKWLTGDATGWRGPWGTTYPANLRLHASKLPAKDWVAAMQKLQTRPPMPWASVQAMRRNDLAAIYQYLRQLGAPGDPAPAFLAPGVEPKTPFVLYPSPKK